jgi:hypothetical protein
LAIISLISAMAVPGAKPLGQVLLTETEPVNQSVLRVDRESAFLPAVHDGVATVQGHFVLKLITTFNTELIAGIDHPAVSLHEYSGTQVFFLQSKRHLLLISSIYGTPRFMLFFFLILSLRIPI